SSIRSMRKQDSYLQLVSGVLNRCLSQHSEVEKAEKVRNTNLSKAETLPHTKDAQRDEPGSYDSGRDSSDDDDGWKQKLEAAWLSKALEPALQLYKWASSAAGSNEKQSTSFGTRSFSEILMSIQRSKVGIQDWSLSDLTVDAKAIVEQQEALPELFVPGTIYYLKRNVDDIDGCKKSESYSLWERYPDQNFRRIMISGNLISDHRCDSHYCALRDVLKSLPVSSD
ncbi:hypothetical protein GW17_00052746, partial [Ensete ventricosum]